MGTSRRGEAVREMGCQPREFDENDNYIGIQALGNGLANLEDLIKKHEIIYHSYDNKYAMSTGGFNLDEFQKDRKVKIFRQLSKQTHSKVFVTIGKKVLEEVVKKLTDKSNEAYRDKIRREAENERERYKEQLKHIARACKGVYEEREDHKWTLRDLRLNKRKWIK